MSSKNQNGLKTPSVLAFERKIDPSDALFYSGNWQDKDNDSAWQPIEIREKAVRGTISNKLPKTITDDPLKINVEVEKANLQTVDVATLAAEHDTLKVRFTLRIIGSVGKPNTCNNNDYEKAVKEKIAMYIETYKFIELASRYVHNLANARFLWRNRFSSESVEVKICQVVNGIPEKSWTFNALDFNLKSFSEEEKVTELAKIIANTLADKNGFALFEVITFARMGRGQEVFPSQELVLNTNKGKKNKGDKSKTLYHVKNVAAMHSQKVGNALRTIDTWYAEDDIDFPIAIEPYGAVTTLGKAFRATKTDFYTLRDKWMLKNEELKAEDLHYLVAIIIRGGVFGEKGSDD